MNEKVDTLCSHTSRLGNIERDVETIAVIVQAVEKTSTVSSFNLCLNDHLDDIRLVVLHKALRSRVGRGNETVIHREGTFSWTMTGLSRWLCGGFQPTDWDEQ